jgi:hypothetical protein
VLVLVLVLVLGLDKTQSAPTHKTKTRTFAKGRDSDDRRRLRYTRDNTVGAEGGAGRYRRHDGSFLHQRYYLPSLSATRLRLPLG